MREDFREVEQKKLEKVLGQRRRKKVWPSSETRPAPALGSDWLGGEKVPGISMSASSGAQRQSQM
jgi:hypothetical protein